MTTTAEQRGFTISLRGIRWLRVIIAGVLLEFALVAVLVPIGAVFGVPPGLGTNVTQNAVVFLTAVPVACFVLGYCASRIVVRNVSADHLAHGVLVGITATAFYLAMSALVGVGGLRGVIAAYGPLHFWGTQFLRIAGCTLGGLDRAADSLPQ